MWFGLNPDQIPDLSPFQSKPVLGKDCWHVLFSIHSSHEELLRFARFISPRSLLPWTECARSTLEQLQSLCKEGPLPPIVIPALVTQRFPSLLSSPAGPLVLKCPEILVTEDPQETSPTLSCWSPTPPSSPVAQTTIPSHEPTSLTYISDPDDCILLEEPFYITTERTPCQNQHVGW